MNSTIPVHVATGIDNAAFFADWPVDQLDEVIPLLQRWGLTDSDGDDTGADGNAVGEFFHTGRRVIFRVTVMAD
jgi:hypothetical protein